MRNRFRAVGVALVLVLGACSPTTTAPSGTPAQSAVAVATNAPGTAGSPGATVAATPDRVAGWQSDLATLIPGMARLHKNLYHSVSEEALGNAVAQLSATVPTATDDQLLDGVLRVVAMVSAGGCDAHTGAFIWGEGTYPVDSLPMRLWLFGDDVVIVAALAPYQDLVGQRIVSIDGHPIGDVLAALDPLIPRDN